MSVFAIGDTNIDGGGNNLGGSTSGNTKWGSPYAQGVRVSVVNSAGQNIVTPIDISSQSSYVNSNVKFHFGKYNKIQYTNGMSLRPTTTAYTAIQYSDLPTVINGNVSTVRSYFSNYDKLVNLSRDLGISYATLTNGSNKLLIEPVAYVTYISDLYAVTATESAMFGDMMPVVNSYNMSAYDYHLFTLARGSLPLAIFLEKSDLGIPSHGGASSGTFSNAYIKSTLGIGIVSFAYDLSVDTLTPETTTPKEMTDIYANVKVSNNTKSSKTADLEILVSGNVIKTQSVTLTENSSKTFKVTGISIPTGVTARKLTARINWTNRETETNANNNYQTVDFKR